jgi:hypothetical protein
MLPAPRGELFGASGLRQMNLAWGTGIAFAPQSAYRKGEIVISQFTDSMDFFRSRGAIKQRE